MLILACVIQLFRFLCNVRCAICPPLLSTPTLPCLSFVVSAFVVVFMNTHPTPSVSLIHTCSLSSFCSSLCHENIKKKRGINCLFAHKHNFAGLQGGGVSTETPRGKNAPTPSAQRE
ncbi:hypothetical protein DFJ73DRAFT_50566 [Zopfochytrium polystomum]|nr:hypothetical protein DFJ73DRAFT_50566 [Zopfochytrium polystomum]